MLNPVQSILSRLLRLLLALLLPAAVVLAPAASRATPVSAATSYPAYAYDGTAASLSHLQSVTSTAPPTAAMYEYDGLDVLTVAPNNVDPHTAGVANLKAALEAKGIPVTQTEMKIIGKEGQILTDADLVTPNAIIEYKSGTARAGDVVRQVQQRIEPNVTRPVVVFGENLSADTLNRAGGKILITNDVNLLIEVIK